MTQYITPYRNFLLTALLMALIGLFLSTSCRKENLDDCFTNAGKTITETRNSSYFDRVIMNDNINLIISPGDEYMVNVEGGENLLDAITTEIKDSVLVIGNTMKCNWARSYEHELNVHIKSPSLKSITYESSGDILSNGLLMLDSLEINVWGGGGSVQLEIVCQILNLGLHYGTVDFTVSGTSQMTTIYANSYGPFYCNELNSNIVYIRNNGSNNCYVHANHILEAEITGVGSIYYTGEPFLVKCNNSGTGEFKKL